jgi:four helix bundle protein
MGLQNFTDLNVWKDAHALTLEVYKITKTFPQEERFSLTNQMQRASISVISNIAEGFGRNSGKDKAQFYAISKGSVMELQAQMLIAKDLGYVTEKRSNELEQKMILVARMLSGLIKTVSDRK